MLGKRSQQQGMFQADHLYLDFVGADTFYGFLARHRTELFRDEDFAMLYCRDLRRLHQPPAQSLGECLVALVRIFDCKRMIGFRMRRRKRVQTTTCAGR